MGTITVSVDVGAALSWLGFFVMIHGLCLALAIANLTKAVKGIGLTGRVTEVGSVKKEKDKSEVQDVGAVQDLRGISTDPAQKVGKVT